MIQPNDLKNSFLMAIPNDKLVPTIKVWNMLLATYTGNIAVVKQLIAEEGNLAYAQYNYMPPIHLAVREGNKELVAYFLSLGACDPNYKTYPFLDNLVNMATARGYIDIASQLVQYAQEPFRQQFKGDNGEIHYTRTALQKEFEQAVDQQDIVLTEKLLREHPTLALNETYFWGEGILMMPAKEGAYELIDLLIAYGATVPQTLKWAHAYYFETLAHAAYMLERNIDPNIMDIHGITVLHHVAQKGNIEKAELLLKYGAKIDPIDEEYATTPIGMAAKWRQLEMVAYLLKQGADPNKSSTPWSKPLAIAKLNEHEPMVKLLSDAGATL